MRKSQVYLLFNPCYKFGPGVCATSRTVPGSIPDGVTGFFSDTFFPTVPWPWGQLSP